MIAQIIAAFLTGAAAIQDFKTQEIDSRLVLVIVASSTITQLFLGFDNLIGLFAFFIFISLLVMEHYGYVGKADVLIVPAIIAINPFWDNVMIYAFGCVTPLSIAMLEKKRQPMIFYLFIAQLIFTALRAINFTV